MPVQLVRVLVVACGATPFCDNDDGDGNDNDNDDDDDDDDGYTAARAWGFLSVQLVHVLVVCRRC